MELAVIDWVIIVGFLLLSLFIGLRYTKKASSDLASFFLGGRNLPWYIAGISMVATTFAADTPLAVTEMVADNGISKNWLWWSFLIGGLLTTFFFARLWRRAEILTEPELIEFRYSGKEASFLRGFKAVYLGVFMNCIVIAWVNFALVLLLKEFFGVSDDLMPLWIFGFMAIAVIYSSLSGLLGVAITDTVQFFIAMIGVIILAIIVVNHEDIGGIEGLKSTLSPDYFTFFPSVESTKIAASETTSPSGFSTLALSIGAFLSFVAIQWWASWYPGAEPGGGGYIAQRMMSTKNERHSIFATLFFNIGHFCLRPWPWIVVALCAVALYSPQHVVEDQKLVDHMYLLKEGNENVEVLYEEIPGLEAIAMSNDTLAKALPTGVNDVKLLFAALPQLEELAANNPQVEKSAKFMFKPGNGYVFAMKDYLPTGLKGLLLVAFLAAYLSTISTQVNWGASYLVNDLHKRFVQKEEHFPSKERAEKHYVKASRWYSLVIMLIALITSQFIGSISGMWEFIMNCGAGLGLVLILRWYWWRINAWSEIAATVAPFIGYTFSWLVLEPALGETYEINKGTFIFTVLFTTIVWIAVTYLTKPTDRKKLLEFYRKVKPDGQWKPIQAEAGIKKAPSQTKILLICWLSSIAMVYSVLFAIGKVIFKEWNEALICIAVASLSFVVLRSALKKTNIFSD